MRHAKGTEARAIRFRYDHPYRCHRLPHGSEVVKQSILLLHKESTASTAGAVPLATGSIPAVTVTSVRAQHLQTCHYLSRLLTLNVQWGLHKFLQKGCSGKRKVVR
jgi:hypothetical protein